MGHYKDKEFAAFIKMIDEGQAGHWVEIARALSISEDTIVKWKKEPEAQEAIQRSIDNALIKMSESGAKDWRMWETKLKMLGLNPATKLAVEVDDRRKTILDKYLGEDDAGQTQETPS